MATTRSRPRGRETARPNTGGAVAEHLGKIYAVAIAGAVIIIAFLALTGIGHVIDLAVQHFMLFYAGVFALIGLCASVGAGLIATDRMFLNPGHRVMVQSVHRAASFGALAFLIIHIVTEILAQRVHVIDAFVPFLSPFRTFYIGLGTISSDIILLLVITGIFRKKFTGNGKTVWRWRAIHYMSYAAFVFGVWHGLLGGRPGKPYVDWSYGFVVAFVALGLAVRILANSLRPKESLSSPPVAEGTASASAPMRAASMFAQLGAARAAAPTAMMAPSGAVGMLAGGPGGPGGFGGAGAGAMQAMAALPSAPGYGDTTVVPGYAETVAAAPIYEPGYEGPPRYAGAPRDTGPLPQGTGRVPQASGYGSGPVPRPGTGPMPRAATGAIPQAPGAASGGQYRPPTGPMPRAATGPVPMVPGAPSGPNAPGMSQPTFPNVPGGFSRQRPMTGPMPRVPGAPSGASARPATGPMPRVATGGMPQASGPRSGPAPRSMTGPTPQASGPMPRPGSGPTRRASTGAMPQAPGARSGPVPRRGTGPVPRPGTGPVPRPGTGPVRRPGNAGLQPGGAGPGAPAYDDGQAYGGQAYGGPAGGGQGQWDSGFPETDPNLKYRMPGPGMPGYRAPDDRYRGSDELR